MQEGNIITDLLQITDNMRRDQYGMSFIPGEFIEDVYKRQHVVWFEDARSAREKLALSEAYDLYGVTYWNLMRPFPQNWLVLNGNYEIIRK